MQHLPATPDELKSRGWDTIDVLLVTGDAHVDHPAFPAALIGRVLDAAGYRVAVISRPNVKDVESVRKMGRPRLFAGVTAGALDSMVANTTASRRRRSDDPHAPDGKAGGRPDRALTVYCNLLRQAFGKDVFIVAGGLEASLRRFAHYDYWSDSVRRPILMDCGADVAIYGMGEGPVVEVASRLDMSSSGSESVSSRGRGNAPTEGSPSTTHRELLRDVPGVVWRQPASAPAPTDGIALPTAEEVAKDPQQHIRSHRLLESGSGARMWQVSGGMRVIANPPAEFSSEALEALARLPFTRNPHPMYGYTRIPALEQVRFSVTSHRGCAGGCAFCALTAHQGKSVTSRSSESVLDEVKAITDHPDFKGTINDIGGPTANMWQGHCTKPGGCSRASCLWPSRCTHFADDQDGYRELLAAAADLPGVRHLFVTTGVRMDLLAPNRALLKSLAQHHTSGHLKVAPEHTVPSVLHHMRKPAGDAFEQVVQTHRALSRKAGKHQFVVPYLMAAHPGCTLDDMVQLGRVLRSHNIKAEQCQIFTPTPGTAATVMYATGLDPANGKEIFVERNPARKELQKMLILWHRRDLHPKIRKALKKAGRADLIEEFFRE
jgi:uncharacterized radical SAM protein YgiQ